MDGLDPEAASHASLGVRHLATGNGGRLQPHLGLRGAADGHGRALPDGARAALDDGGRRDGDRRAGLAGLRR
eukprot:6743249-Lingulodinium_polyedra.AAC.1